MIIPAERPSESAFVNNPPLTDSDAKSALDLRTSVVANHQYQTALQMIRDHDPCRRRRSYIHVLTITMLAVRKES